MTGLSVCGCGVCCWCQGASAKLQHPLAVSVVDSGVLVADSYNHRLKLVDPVTNTIKSLVGNGRPGFRDGKGASQYCYLLLPPRHSAGSLMTMHACLRVVGRACRSAGAVLGAGRAGGLAHAARCGVRGRHQQQRHPSRRPQGLRGASDRQAVSQLGVGLGAGTIRWSATGGGRLVAKGLAPFVQVTTLNVKTTPSATSEVAGPQKRSVVNRRRAK